jgi:trimethylamine--corrinoid protein Co-methyltransferase
MRQRLPCLRARPRLRNAEIGASSYDSGLFTHAHPPYEVFSEQDMAVLERGWRRLISEVGVRFDSPEALDRFRRAGQTVGEGGVVRFDPDFVLEQVALAPGSFTLVARNPARTVRIGGPDAVFGSVAGPPFVRRGDERREGTYADFCDLTKLAQAFDDIDLPTVLPCDAADLPIDSRHLDMALAEITLTDKPLHGGLFSGEKARDVIAMAEIVFGGRSAIERTPVLWSVVNVNSPLRYDTAMIDVLVASAEANQVTLVTPFLLMGAMAPVTIPAALVQQTTEQLAGVALTQLVRPGSPVMLGSFLSHTDMQSGAPGFGGPESTIGLLASGQLARRFGLPWRAGGGGLTSSQLPDGQAMAEAANTMLAGFLACTNFFLHAAGWLESGLTASFEKFVLDIELLRILEGEFTPLQVDEEALAFDAHLEVGHAGHFLGAGHTLERFRDCFYRPFVFSTQSFERWAREGGEDAAVRAGRVWRETLDAYEEPLLDDGVRAELEEFVARRRRQLGD